MTAPRGEPTGSVHEETARLFAALEGAAAAWSRGEPAGAAAGSAAGSAAQDDGAGAGPAGARADTSHLPTTCGACPLCLALDRLGRSRPEVLDHLTDAVQALGAALAAATKPPAAGEGDGHPPEPPSSAPRAEPIEVTD